MFDIFVIGYLSYRNGIKAKLKGQSPWKWGILTFFASFFALIFGMYFVLVSFCRDAINLSQLNNFNYKANLELAARIEKMFEANPLRMVTYYMIGFGGYLVIRFFLDKRPDKKKPEMNWMDKMNQEQE